MRTLATALAAVAVLGGAGLAQDEQREVTVGTFDRIEAGGGYRIEVVQGDTDTVRLEGDSADFDEIGISVRNGRLDISQDRGWFSRHRDIDVVVIVTVSRIESLEFNRGISARVEGVDAGSLQLRVNTGAVASVSGMCDALEVDITTGAALNAAGLVCQRVEARASTGAEASLHADVRIDARASMGGSLLVHGAPPQYEVHTSMGGDVSLRGDG